MASVTNSRRCVRAARTCRARALIRRARCRSWISTTRCVSPCRRPAAAAARRWARSTSAPGRKGIHPRQARGRAPAPVQPVPADHRRFHGSGGNRRRWPLVFPMHARKKDEKLDLAIRASHLARMAGARNYVVRRWTRGVQDLRPHPRHTVGHDHDLDVRLRRARIHPDRSRQRNEQQLVVREHPRDQSVRRAAAAALWFVPARLGESDRVRARSVLRRARFDREEYAKSCACSRACSTTSSRSTGCRSSSSATRS